MFKLIVSALLCFLGFSVFVNHRTDIEIQDHKTDLWKDLINLDIFHFRLLRQNLLQKFILPYYVLLQVPQFIDPPDGNLCY